MAGVREAGRRGGRWWQGAWAEGGGSGVDICLCPAVTTIFTTLPPLRPPDSHALRAVTHTHTHTHIKLVNMNLSDPL